MEKQRIEFIDLAKGLCISLVLLFHIHCFETTTETALSFFRMPLYYFLSGIFFKKYSGLMSFLTKKINKLIVPYLFFFITAYLAGIVCHFLHLYEKGIIQEPFQWNMIFDIFTKLSRGENIGYNSPIWFLISLFEVNIIFYILQSYIKKHLLFIIFLIGITSSLIGLPNLPYFIDKSLKALPFFAVGYSSQNLIMKKMEIKKGIALIFTLCCFIFLYFCASFSPSIRNSFIVYYLAGLTGIFMILSISKILNKLPIFSYIGRYSLIVLGFHTFLVGPMRYVFSFTSPIEQYVLSFISIIILMRFFVIPISLKLFPYFTAQKDIINYPSNNK